MKQPSQCLSSEKIQAEIVASCSTQSLSALDYLFARALAFGLSQSNLNTITVHNLGIHVHSDNDCTTQFSESKDQKC